MNDSFVCHCAWHFCLDPDCDHTCCVPDEIVLRLVAPDDIEVVAEETIGLEKYTPAQREEFIKCTVKELQGLELIAETSREHRSFLEERN